MSVGDKADTNGPIDWLEDRIGLIEHTDVVYAMSHGYLLEFKHDDEYNDIDDGARWPEPFPWLDIDKADTWMDGG